MYVVMEELSHGRHVYGPVDGEIEIEFEREDGEMDYTYFNEDDIDAMKARFAANREATNE